MSKAILVMDMPETCLDCRFCIELDEGVEACCEIICDPDDSSLYRMIEDYCQCRPSWCPLKEMPTKVSGEVKIRSDEYSDGFADGFNFCLNEIYKQE